MSRQRVAVQQLATDVVRTNLLANGGFEIWLRGNGPFSGAGTYGPDRWQTFPVGTDALSATRDAANADIGSQFDAALIYTKGNSTSFFYQNFITANEGFHIRGRTVSLSVRAKSSVANAVRISLTPDGGTTQVFSR